MTARRTAPACSSPPPPWPGTPIVTTGASGSARRAPRPWPQGRRGLRRDRTAPRRPAMSPERPRLQRAGETGRQYVMLVLEGEFRHRDAPPRRRLQRHLSRVVAPLPLDDGPATTSALSAGDRGPTGRRCAVGHADLAEHGAQVRLDVRSEIPAPRPPVLREPLGHQPQHLLLARAQAVPATGSSGSSAPRPADPGACPRARPGRPHGVAGLGILQLISRRARRDGTPHLRAVAERGEHEHPDAGTRARNARVASTPSMTGHRQSP